MQIRFIKKFNTPVTVGTCLLASGLLLMPGCSAPVETADLVVLNAKVAVGEHTEAFEEAVAVKDGRFFSVGNTQSISTHIGPSTRVIDAGGRTMIPGLNDSHQHLIRAGLNYNLELRWDGVRSLDAALQMLREQAARTPDGAWIRVVGGWSEYQFEEQRLPTLDEINAAVPDKPVYIMYLYSLGFINQTGLEQLQYDEDTYFPGGEVQLDDSGKPTGLLVAKPSALLLYQTLTQLPKLSHDEQLNSTRHFYRELNRLAVTSAIDAGGGGQNHPDDYAVAETLARQGKLTVRTAYYLFAQKKGEEQAFFESRVKQLTPGTNLDMFKPNGYLMEGAGENLVWSAADFENFLEPRPHLDEVMESELTPVIELLASNKWPFRIHATYDESINRFLDVFADVDSRIPFLHSVRWTIDHAETVSRQTLQRISDMGGGIAIQNRMYFQGEHFSERYGASAAGQAPPLRDMIELGIPIGLGTDATRVSSYNPWFALHWAVTGKSWGNQQILDDRHRLTRQEAIHYMTSGSAWFSGEEHEKGLIKAGMFADFALLSEDYYSCPEDRIRDISSVLTVVNGQVVFGDKEFEDLDPDIDPPLPLWSPVGHSSEMQKHQ